MEGYRKLELALFLGSATAFSAAITNFGGVMEASRIAQSTEALIVSGENKARAEIPNMPDISALTLAKRLVSDYEVLDSRVLSELSETGCSPRPRSIYPDLEKACTSLETYNESEQKYQNLLEQRGITALRENIDGLRNKVTWGIPGTMLGFVFGGAFSVVTGADLFYYLKNRPKPKKTEVYSSHKVSNNI